MTEDGRGKARRRRFVIAIDGPAGVGKSTVGRLVAKRLGYKFINTGEMYRALTWKALERGVPLTDGEALTRLARETRWEFKTDVITIRTWVDGTLIGPQIRLEEVSRSSSIVAGVPGVRRHFRGLQRDLGRDGGIVMEGRDITTNVFPDAEFKFYLDAAIEERARRRYGQLFSQGLKADFARIEAAIRQRDAHDSKRRINPLRRAADATVIDSTRMTLHEVADAILRKIRSGRSRRRAGKS